MTSTNLRRQYSEADDDYIRQHFGKIPHFELCNRLGRTTNSLVRHAKLQLGLTCQNRVEMRKLSIGENWFNHHEDELLRLHYGKVTRKTMMALLPGRTWMGIRSRARKLQVKTLGKSALCRLSKLIYSHDSNFFSRPNILNSYYAGLIAADGCVSSRGRLSLVLQERDGHAVRGFHAAIGYTGPVFLAARYGSAGPKVGVQMFASSVAKDLQRNYSITPRKSKTLMPPPSLNLPCSLAFIVGYIDGDGCIGHQDGLLRFSIRGTKDVLDWMVNIFHRKFTSKFDATNKHRMASVKRYPSDSTYSYSVCGRRAEMILHGLMAIDVPRLHRKWVKVGHTPRITED